MEQAPQNEYEVLILPVDYNKSFLDFFEREIKEYYQWFLKIKNQRLVHLCKFLFKNQECLSEKNLNVIEIFLQNSISILPKPEKQFAAEMEQVPLHLKPYVEPDS